MSVFLGDFVAIMEKWLGCLPRGLVPPCRLGILRTKVWGMCFALMGIIDCLLVPYIYFLLKGGTKLKAFTSFNQSTNSTLRCWSL